MERSGAGASAIVARGGVAVVAKGRGRGRSGMDALDGDGLDEGVCAGAEGLCRRCGLSRGAQGSQDGEEDCEAHCACLLGCEVWDVVVVMIMMSSQSVDGERE